MLFILRTSKTHNISDKPQLVKIKEAPEKFVSKETKSCKRKMMEYHKRKALQHFCPYQLLLEFSQTRPKYKSMDEPFFVFRDRTPVCPSNIRKTLKQMLSRVNFNEDCYDKHSLRIGRSVDLLRLGLSMETIKNSPIKG